MRLPLGNLEVSPQYFLYPLTLFRVLEMKHVYIYFEKCQATSVSPPN